MPGTLPCVQPTASSAAVMGMGGIQDDKDIGVDYGGRTSGGTRDLRRDSTVRGLGEPVLVLASGSPRRVALLQGLGLAFQVAPADVDESPLPGEAPETVAVRLAEAKAAAVRAHHPGAVVLAADTVVALHGRALGKPADAAEAAATLRSLRGRCHTVLTAVCVTGPSAAPLAAVARSSVRMRHYSDREIAIYVASGDPFDKAGSYAIQHPTFRPVASLEGSYTNVVGLPVELTAELLARAGVALPSDVARRIRQAEAVEIAPAVRET
jgi:septum formation protein